MSVQAYPEYHKEPAIIFTVVEDGTAANSFAAARGAANGANDIVADCEEIQFDISGTPRKITRVFVKSSVTGKALGFLERGPGDGVIWEYARDGFPKMKTT